MVKTWRSATTTWTPLQLILTWRLYTNTHKMNILMWNWSTRINKEQKKTENLNWLIRVRMKKNYCNLRYWRIPRYPTSKQTKDCRDPGVFRVHCNSLNQGPSDLQSDALPTELSRQLTVNPNKVWKLEQIKNPGEKKNLHCNEVFTLKGCLCKSIPGYYIK